MRDETAKDNRQTTALIIHDLTRNNELAFSSTRILQFYRFQILKFFFLDFGFGRMDMNDILSDVKSRRQGLFTMYMGKPVGWWFVQMESKIPKRNIWTENVLTMCHSKTVPSHTPIFICVTWDASTWLLLKVLFSCGDCTCSCQLLSKNFERAIWTHRSQKLAPQPHKNQQSSSDLSSWKLQWLILSGILHFPRNREVIPRQLRHLKSRSIRWSQPPFSRCQTRLKLFR